MRIHHLAVLLFAGTLEGQNLGLFESHGDLGATPKSGTLEVTGTPAEYRVTGGGANIWGTEDAMHFVWKRLSGDVTLTADVRFQGPGVNAHRKGVLMLRQDLTPGAAYAVTLRRVVLVP